MVKFSVFFYNYRLSDYFEYIFLFIYFYLLIKMISFILIIVLILLGLTSDTI